MSHMLILFGWGGRRGGRHRRPEDEVHGCCTKFRQNPMLAESAGLDVPSSPSVRTLIVNGFEKPEMADVTHDAFTCTCYKMYVISCSIGYFTYHYTICAVVCKLGPGT